MQMKAASSLAFRLSPSGNAFNDPHIPLDRVLPEDLERFLVGRSVVCGNRLLETVEFDHDDALRDSGLVRLRGGTAHDKPAARSLYRRSCDLGIRRQRVGIFDGTISHYPVSLGHESLLV